MDDRLVLPANAVLDGSYRILRAVGSGGFGITYEAEDTNLGTLVAIKEYYPADFADRDATMNVRPKSGRHKKTFDWGRSSFLQEARTLARFRHPSVVQVTRVFEAHSTAYMVMVFEQGHDFGTWLKELERPPTQEELDRIVGPLLEALEIMHAEDFLHRDIAPDNIIIRRDGTPVLLDFGAARRAVAEASRSITGIVKAGYSPPEQYSSNIGLQGPWSDIYALGATLYLGVTGHSPHESTLRVDVDRMVPASRSANGIYRPSFLSAIDTCLRVKQSERPRTIGQLRPLLFGQYAKIADHPLGARRWRAMAAALLTLLGGAYAGFRYTHWNMPLASEEQPRIAAIDEARHRADEQARQEAQRRAGMERKAAEERTRKETEERRLAEAAAAKKKTEDQALAKAQADAAEAKRRADEVARQEAERRAAIEKKAAEGRARKETEERRLAEAAAAKKKTEDQALAKAQADAAEAKRRADEKARQEAEQRAAVEKKAAEDRARKEAEERRPAEAAAAKKKAEDEALAKAESEVKQKAAPEDRGRAVEPERHAALDPHPNGLPQKSVETRPARLDGQWKQTTHAANEFCYVQAGTRTIMVRGQRASGSDLIEGEVGTNGHIRFVTPSRQPGNQRKVIHNGKLSGSTGSGSYYVVGGKCRGTFTMRR